MPEIYQFKIHKAEAAYEDNKLTVRLFYPKNPQPIEKRLAENLPFGISVLESLLAGRQTQIADENNPVGPSSAGSLYVLSDDVFVCHRRDKFAPTHKLYHGAYAGYADSKQAVYSEQGIVQTGIRETAEECLLVTKDKTPRLIVPNDSKEHTIESAKRLGLDLQPRYVDVEILEPRDKLKVYNADGELMFTARAFIDLLYESATSLSALQIRKLPLSSEEVFPIDAEGMIKDGKFMHFNRESYMIKLSEIQEKSFGSLLNNPRVFQTKIENGIPRTFTPEYSKPYLGPDKVEVTNPHVFAPEDLLTVCLDALDVNGFKGKKLEIELWKEKSKLKGNSLLPKEVVANG